MNGSVDPDLPQFFHVEAVYQNVSADGRARVGRAGSSFVLDPIFYLETWRDVRESGLDPLDHYEDHGRMERRQCCEAQMLSDIAAIEASGVLAQAAANGYSNGGSPRDCLINYFLGSPPITDFFPKFLLEYYPRTLVEGEHPFAFYCRHAQLPWCFGNAADAAAHADIVRSSSLFDRDYLLGQMAPELRHLDPALYYVTEGFRARLDPSASFSTRTYVLEHPDIAACQMNPLVHFEIYGRVEKRRIGGRRDINIEPGGQAFRCDRPTLLICSNEAGRSGAPMVGLNLARHLRGEYNVISAFLRGGPLMDSFVALSTAVAICGDGGSTGVVVVDELCSRYPLHGAILNSVEGALIAGPLKRNGVPVVTLIHDFAQYVAPFNVMARTMAMSDRTLFPAEIVKTAALREIAQNGFEPSAIRNVNVCAQGRSRLPPVDSRDEVRMRAVLAKSRGEELTIVGAGMVQARKGLDLFVDTARVLKHELGVACRFLWVGAGYDPRADLVTSVYVAEQIRASDLEDVVFFVPELQDLEAVWRAADVFFMSSRLDPFPNVALDALAEGLPVVCFQQATGIAELTERLPDRVAAVAYADTWSAARAIKSMAAGGRREPCAILDDLLSFKRYAAEVARELEAAAADKPVVADLATDLRRTHVDPMLLFGDLPDWPALKELCGSVDGLYAVASRAALNGVALGRLRHGRTTRLPGIVAADVEAGRRQDVWSDDDYDRLMLESDKPLSAVLISEEAREIANLAELAFGGAQGGRFVVVSETATDLDLRPLIMAAGKDDVLHVKPGEGAKRAADFLHLADPLLISPRGSVGTWTKVARRLAALRPKHQCCVALAAVERGAMVSARMPAPRGLESKISIDRRLVEETVCRLYAPTLSELTSMIRDLSMADLGVNATVWGALMRSPTLLERGWVLDEADRHARIEGYDLLIGREPILVV